MFANFLVLDAMSRLEFSPYSLSKTTEIGNVSISNLADVNVNAEIFMSAHSASSEGYLHIVYVTFYTDCSG